MLSELEHAGILSILGVCEAEHAGIPDFGRGIKSGVTKRELSPNSEAYNAKRY